VNEILGVDHDRCSYHAGVEHIVLLDRAALRTTIRRPAFPHSWSEHATTSPDEVLERLRGATIAVVNAVAIDGKVLADPASADLRLIAVAATGVDRVDLAAAAERGVWVTNIRGWCDQSVAEHVLCLALALRRRLLDYHAAVRDGTWARSPSYSLLFEPLPLEIQGQVMGIVGFGSTGQAVARTAGALGMEVLVAEHKGRPARPGRTPFEETLARSDVVSLHCPLAEETRNLIGAPELALLRPHALLVNCARGGVVDEAALAKALSAGQLGGAGVDVLVEEPPRTGSPLLDPGVPNVIVTTHMAWASQQALATLVEQLIANIEAFVAGTPRNVVVAGA
jgi:glycerate dehydrogenase